LADRPVRPDELLQVCSDCVSPTQFYLWQKQLFEQGAVAFEARHGKPQADLRDQKIARLEAKLAQKNEVVAELLHEHVQLKKELGEL
jgi:hypothetical protein